MADLTRARGIASSTDRSSRPEVCVSLALLFAFSAGASLRAQEWKRKEGREDIVDIVVAGKAEATVERVEKWFAAEPERTEPLFVLAAAHTALGELGAAVNYARRALAAGVPAERFFAGPAELVGRLVATPEFQRAVNGETPVLLHGPMVGSVTESSARFWVRTTREISVGVVLRAVNSASETGGGAAESVSAEVFTKAERDRTAVVTAGGLRPDTEYEYSLVLDGERQTVRHRLRTFPPAGRPARFAVAFGGGAAFTPEREYVFTTIAGRKPVAFLQLGDNVYIDEPESRVVQEYCYYRRQSSSAYRGLVASTSIAAIWDDHDFGDNDCWGGPEIETPPWKRDVWNTFRNNWNNPSYGGGRAQPGCYFDFEIGDVHFILLDCRYYRTAPNAPGPRSMLGAAQKKWLFDRLKSSRGTFKILTSSVPFSQGTKPGSKDTWDGYAEEREEIFSFIAENRVDGVVLVAADRHRSDAWRTERPSAYPLYEFMSSRLTNSHVHRVFPQSLFGYNEKCSFGMLAFDTTIDDPEVRYTIVDLDGRDIYSLTLRRSQLAVPEDSGAQ